MKVSFYRERDYAFGQAILTLRTRTGLTQAGLAERLGVSRKAVGEWEAGLTYPTAEHLKALIALAIARQAFAAGREEEEIRAFWQAASQKAQFDEAWLAALLPHAEAPPASQSVEETIDPAHAFAAGGGPRVDWGDALDVPSFYGREWELNLLSQWVVQERCRVVSVLGLGGIGKSALATQVMHRVAERFEVVIWRSLRDVPTCEALLDDCLQVLAPQALRDVSASLERRQGLLLECLRSSRILLVYDNLESFLEEGQDTGHIRPGYEGFAQVLRRVAESEHQSCMLLTSREKPSDLMPLEGSRAPVRALRLARLDADSCQQLLAEKGVAGSAAEQTRLIEAYAGNPLALKIVAQTIVELFDGQIAPFLEQGEVVFGGVRELLGEQYARLSALEQTVLLWLAILRELVSLEELLAVLGAPLPRATVLDAVEALRRRSLIELGQRPGSFTLQSVVLEYATAQLIAEMSSEIEQGRLARLVEHGLELAEAREDVRQTQERLIVVPLLAQVRRAYPRRVDLEGHLLGLLDRLRAWADYAQGYGPANLVALLRVLRGSLRGLDLSHLSLRGVYLQDVEMQDATLSGATLNGCAFTETFDAISAVAISPNGQYWAAASRRGEVRLWEAAGQTLQMVWQAHTDGVPTLAFSPDGHTLASGSWDTTVKLWDVESGTLLWTGWHTNNITSLAFAPDGRLLATSGGNDAMVHFWDLHSGTHLETLSQPDPVSAIAWSADGHLLASGSFNGQIRLWEIQNSWKAPCIAVLEGHTNWVMGLAFARDGRTLASASWDGSVKLWEVGEAGSHRLRQTLAGHTANGRVAWSADGCTLASSSRDTTILLWDVEQGSARAVLRGHAAEVYGLAFTPDGHSLLSGSDDGTLRLWDVASAQCVRIMHGYVSSLLSIDWSPDGTRLASGGTDTLVTIWDVTGGTPLTVLRGHRWTVSGVGWSPDGQFLASSGWDNAIRLWNPATGTSLQIPGDSDNPDTIFFSVAWSPDGQKLAGGAFIYGVLVWDVTARSGRWIGRQLPTRIRHVAWSPDGTRLVGAGDNGVVYVWDASEGTLLQRLPGHQGRVNDVAWSRDGTRLASGGRVRDGGELLVWDMQSGERVRAFVEHLGMVSAVAWGPSGELLVSGGSDGMLRWWEVQSGKCVQVRQAHQGTVQSLKVSPDGQTLASCGNDGAIMLWSLHGGEYLRTLRRDRPYERLDITAIGGLSEAQKASLRALGAIEDAAV